MRYTLAAIALTTNLGVCAGMELGIVDSRGNPFSDTDILANIEIPDLVNLKLNDFQDNEDMLAKNPLEVIEYKFDYGPFGTLKTFAYREGDTVYPPGAGGIMDMNIELLPPNTVNTDDAVVAGPDGNGVPANYGVDEFVMYRYRLCNRITENYPHDDFGETYPIDDRTNTYLDWSITNVHSHGLYLDAEDFSDDVTTRIARGGLCLDYVYRLPDIHYPGTHWYHPHRHGASSLQVAAGLAGMMRVTNDVLYQDSVPRWYQRLLDNAKILQFHKIGLGILERYADETFVPLGRDIPLKDKIIFNQPIVQGSDDFGTDRWLVNGVANGTYTMRENQFRLFDFIFVDQIAFHWNFRFGDCNAWLVSRDGMPRRNGPVKLEIIPPTDPFDFSTECSGPQPDFNFATQVRQYRLPGATRAGIVFQCPAGEHQITINCEDAMVIKSDPARPNARPANQTGVFRRLNQSPDRNGFTRMYDARPPYINEEKSGLDEDDNTPIQELELTAQDVTGPNTPGGKPYSRYTPNAIIDTNKVYDWFLAKGQEIHPYHKHISPIMINGDCFEPEETAHYDIGEFFDVVQERCPSSFRTIWYPTTQVHHCHILQHEDDGALGWVMIDPEYKIPCWENGTDTQADWDANGRDSLFGFDFEKPPPHIGSELCSTSDGRLIAEEWKDKCPSAPFGEELVGFDPSPKRYRWQRVGEDQTYAERCPGREEATA